jgi:dihydrofolate reductase
MTLPFVIVAALADNRVIGDDNRLIWRLKSDLKRFREITLGTPMVMGRKTFLSIGKPLPGRETIVLTREPGFASTGVHVAHSLDDALALGQEIGGRMGARQVTIAGGADVYAQALPQADEMRLTLVHAAPSGDAVFPEWGRSDFAERHRSDHPAGLDDEFPFTFVDLVRVKGAIGR